MSALQPPAGTGKPQFNLKQIYDKTKQQAKETHTKLKEWDPYYHYIAMSILVCLIIIISVSIYYYKYPTIPVAITAS